MKNIRKRKIKIAIPNKGRLQEPTIQILKSIGLDFEITERQLSASVRNFDLEVLFISASNIPEYVQDGVADLGITGYDLVCERSANVKIIEKLGFGKTSLVVAVPENSSIKTLAGLNNKKIATTFVNLLDSFLAKSKIKAEIIKVDGAVEITPWLGLADAIADLTSSGSSLRINRLIPIANILDSQAVLIGNEKLMEEKSAYINTIILRMESVLTAKRKRYIMMNAPEKILPQIKSIAPGLSSPTIMKLSEPGMIAVHSVIETEEVWSVIEKLKKIGATGILVVPIEKMIK